MDQSHQRMGPRKKLIGKFAGILKDKASIIKATITTKRGNLLIKVAILQATTHTSAAPPQDYQLEHILSLGSRAGVYTAAGACVNSIMDRLHSTRDPRVALKCLLILHNILRHGSFLLKEQLISYHPSHSGQNSLKLRKFSDTFIVNDEIRELAQWVLWYASVLERDIISSRNFGTLKSPSKGISNISPEFSIREMDSSVCMIEGISEAPESLHCQKVDLVHELMLLVSEDYRDAQHRIAARLIELCDGDGFDRLSSDESSELILCLKRLEGCRERLTELFANRKRNEGFWDLVGRTKRVAGEVVEKWRSGRMVVVKAAEKIIPMESTRTGDRVRGKSEVIKLLEYNSSQCQRVIV